MIVLDWLFALICWAFALLFLLAFLASTLDWFFPTTDWKLLGREELIELLLTAGFIVGGLAWIGVI